MTWSSGFSGFGVPYLQGSHMLLLIDNYDSFVFNLARYVAELGVETHVVRNDAVSTDDIAELRPRAIIISPGPCSPSEAGISIETVRRFTDQLPILGVCLGHQAIAAAFGGRIVRAPEPVHGRTSLVEHDGQELFDQIDSPVRTMRYHSLIVDRDSLPQELSVTAWTGDIIMGLAHRSRPVFGVQFHPESVLTEHGCRLLSNFLRIAGFDVSGQHRGDVCEAQRFGPGLSGHLGQSVKHWADDNEDSSRTGPALHW